MFCILPMLFTCTMKTSAFLYTAQNNAYIFLIVYSTNHSIKESTIQLILKFIYHVILDKAIIKSIS